ncbi:MAG: ABC transporter permease subunit [bacterium]|nr:ABC transporter permease subunit [bacterium]
MSNAQMIKVGHQPGKGLSFRRRLRDNLARYVVSTSGLLIVIAVVGIVVVLLKESLPLFQRGVIALRPGNAQLNIETDSVLAGFISEYGDFWCGFIEIGEVNCRSLGAEALPGLYSVNILEDNAPGSNSDLKSQQSTGRIVTESTDNTVNLLADGFKSEERVRIVAVYYESGRYWVIDSEGSLRFGSIAVEYNRTAISRRIPQLTFNEEVIVPHVFSDLKNETNSPVLEQVLLESTRGVAFRGFDVWTQGNRQSLALLTQQGSVVWLRLTAKKNMLGKVKVTSQASVIPAELFPEKMLLVAGGDTLIVSGARRTLKAYTFVAGREAELKQSVYLVSNSEGGLVALVPLIGRRSFVTLDERGALANWSYRERAGDVQLDQIAEYSSILAQPEALVASPRGRSAFVISAKGAVEEFNTTTGQLAGRFLPQGPTINYKVRFAGINSKANTIVVLGDYAEIPGKLDVFDVKSPHPEGNLAALFSRLWYEGYDRPEFVWQSSGGTDQFESKFSIVPLIFGTLKGTVFALLFAVPLSLAAALYTSQFMSLSLRMYVKPVVELMAAVPSVVVGFIAGLWLAPRMESCLTVIFVSFFVVPLTVVLAGRFAFTRKIICHAKSHLALMSLALLMGLAFYLSYLIGIQLEWILPGHNAVNFIREEFGVNFDQRNSLVVGVAMGFAVIPVIFTIAEDCISSVPGRLSAASLAMGATRWQTAWKVILPAALPGVFSAVMIGFGRAIGETMIVLMATGNTPLMSMSPFDGFRTMSANIAVELPEAPVGGSLYRVIFVVALLLFIMSFVVNTVSEIVRLRLQKRLEGM